MRDEGVTVQSMRYTGMLHERFGIPPVIAKAKQAQAIASGDRRAASGA